MQFFKSVRNFLKCKKWVKPREIHFFMLPYRNKYFAFENCGNLGKQVKRTGGEDLAGAKVG